MLNGSSESGFSLTQQAWTPLNLVDPGIGTVDKSPAFSRNNVESHRAINLSKADADLKKTTGDFC